MVNAWPRIKIHTSCMCLLAAVATASFTRVTAPCSCPTYSLPNALVSCSATPVPPLLLQNSSPHLPHTTCHAPYMVPNPHHATPHNWVTQYPLYTSTLLRLWTCGSHLDVDSIRLTPRHPWPSTTHAAVPLLSTGRMAIDILLY